MCIGFLFGKRVKQKKNDPLAALYQKLHTCIASMHSISCTPHTFHTFHALH